MSKITRYEKLIQEKRKKTPFRDFVKEIASWETLSFYKNNGHISRYHSSDRVKKMWDSFWDDAPDQYRDLDLDSSFFTQFELLQDQIPMAYTLAFPHLGNNENCEFADAVFSAKNVYLSFVVGFGATNIFYSAFCYANISDVLNSFLITKDCSEIANSHHVAESYKIFYSKNIYGSSNIWFSTNLIGCHECIGCDNLENISYSINNTIYQKDEYLKKKEEIRKDTKMFDRIWQHMYKNTVINFASTNVSGTGIVKSSHIENGLWINNMHNGRNIGIWSGDGGSQNLYDCIDVWANGNDFYGVIAAGWSNALHLYSSQQIDNSSHIYYSMFMWSCHHCVGCIWLKNKSYCILNKQYTKEEWEILAEKIFASMEADGTLWDFFPASMNPFYFNDTLAYLIDDTFTKEEIEKDGYLWRDEPIRADIPEGMKVVKNTELDIFQWLSESGEWYIDPEVLKVVISDEKGNYYRIVQMEYDFLMKHALPLPTMHWLERMKMGFQ